MRWFLVLRLARGARRRDHHATCRTRALLPSADAGFGAFHGVPRPRGLAPLTHQSGRADITKDRDGRDEKASEGCGDQSRSELRSWATAHARTVRRVRTRATPTKIAAPIKATRVVPTSPLRCR